MISQCYEHLCSTGLIMMCVPRSGFTAGKDPFRDKSSVAAVPLAATSYCFLSFYLTHRKNMAVRINLFTQGPRSISILKIWVWILSSMKANSNTFEVKRIFLIYHLRLLFSMILRAYSQYLHIKEDFSRFPIKLTTRHSVALEGI